MKFEVRPVIEAPLANARRGLYDELINPMRNLREGEALRVEPDVGKSLDTMKSGLRKLCNRPDLGNFELRTDVPAGVVWVLRKGRASVPQAPAAPVREVVRPAAPLGAALAAGGA